jgi:hypothetical protein
MVFQDGNHHSPNGRFVIHGHQPCPSAARTRICPTVAESNGPVNVAFGRRRIMSKCAPPQGCSGPFSQCGTAYAVWDSPEYWKHSSVVYAEVLGFDVAEFRGANINTVTSPSTGFPMRPAVSWPDCSRPAGLNLVRSGLIDSRLHFIVMSDVVGVARGHYWRSLPLSSSRPRSKRAAKSKL